MTIKISSLKEKIRQALNSTERVISEDFKISNKKKISLNEKKSYNFLHWNSAYDNFSLNYIFSINPKRNEYLPVIVPSGLEGFGSTIKIMLIYNY